MPGKRGRPPKPPEERRGLRIEVRVNPDERRLFDLAADKVGLDLSEWMRTVLLRSAKRKRTG